MKLTNAKEDENSRHFLKGKRDLYEVELEELDFKRRDDNTTIPL